MRLLVGGDGAAEKSIHESHSQNATHSKSTE